MNLKNTKTIILILLLAITPAFAKEDVRRDIDKGDVRRVRSGPTQDHNPVITLFLHLLFGT